jgi:hypothetical protein
MASGNQQPLKSVRQMLARERELGELPSPICPGLTARLGRDLLFSPSAKNMGNKEQSDRSKRFHGFSPEWQRREANSVQDG